MRSCYTISALAKAANVPTSTVRYYERAGLLKPIGRTESNYRRYDESSLERLHFIRAAKAGGFALSDVVTLLELSDEPRGACDRVRALIEGRLADVQQRLDELQRVERVLEAALRSCRKGRTKQVCTVLTGLKHGVTG